MHIVHGLEHDPQFLDILHHTSMVIKAGKVWNSANDECCWSWMMYSSSGNWTPQKKWKLQECLRSISQRLESLLNLTAAFSFASFPHLPPHHRNAHPHILLPFLLSSSWLQPVPHCSTTPLRRPTTLAPLLASKSVVSPIDVFKLWLVLAVLDWTFDVTGWCDPLAYCS